MKKIGLLGCGTIGTKIAMAIDCNKINAVLTTIYDQNIMQATKLSSKLKTKPNIVNNVALLASSSHVDLIIEAASQKAVQDNALTILQNKKDLMILSFGALLDTSIFDIIKTACHNFKQKVFLPSGAISGLDGIKSIKNELTSVTLITKKNPQSFQGAKFFDHNNIDLNKIHTATTLYEGNAKNAVVLFPANTNVSAILSLCGLGSDKTMIKIIADPIIHNNIHIIEAKGKFGQINIKIENIISDNPKTSMLAIFSAIECLRSICSDDDIILGT